jgi:hypothetical protein
MSLKGTEMIAFGMMIFILLPACALARLLIHVRPGSVLSAGICLLLRGLYALDGAEALFAAEAERPPAARLARISNHAILSLDIAARFNTLILLLKHAFRNPEPVFS